VVRALGPSWALERARYEARLRSGLLRTQLPVQLWSDIPLDSFLTDSMSAEANHYLEYRRNNSPGFFFDPADRDRYAGTLRGWDATQDGAIQRAEEVLRGVFTYFSHLKVDLGPNPNWHRNAMSGEVAPRNQHWSTISDFGYGDIKVIWEPSRFGWAYDLVRAYWRTGDERYPERFWQLLEHWSNENPPNQGPNWKCGQETSLRVMAWCFALYGFMDAESTTSSRVSHLSQMIAFSGERILATLGYALSQKNNHGVSEGMGLWTIGGLFPEFLQSARWRQKGRQVLEQLGRELIYDDGAFSQHSVNYHRVMLDGYVWSITLGRMLDQPFSDELIARVGRAADLLYQMQDVTTGQLPCYGANDGALILPLSSAPYSDYRPVVQAARYLTNNSLTYESGEWDETLLWLFGPDAIAAPLLQPERLSLVSSSGYATLRSSTGFLFSRCPSTFVHRPGDADILGADIWWNGVNVAIDPGTFSYNAPPPWNHELRRSRYHNVVTIDGEDQMEPVSRFLWAPWPHGKWHPQRHVSDGIEMIEGEHDGYKRLDETLGYRRAFVRIGHDHWLIADRVVASDPHVVGVNWLVDDANGEAEVSRRVPERFDLSLATATGRYDVVIGSTSEELEVMMARGDGDTAGGWVSPRYNERKPGLAVAATIRSERVLMWTLLGPGIFDVTFDDMELAANLNGIQLRARLSFDANLPIVQTVEVVP
jgi:asparagine synthase (glutamine-hydrolysing)